MAGSVSIRNKTLALDKDGYLANLDDWSVSVAEELARQEGLVLTPEHWEIIDLMREFHQRRGLSPVMRILVKLVEKLRLTVRVAAFGCPSDPDDV